MKAINKKGKIFDSIQIEGECLTLLDPTPSPFPRGRGVKKLDSRLRGNDKSWQFCHEGQTLRQAQDKLWASAAHERFGVVKRNPQPAHGGWATKSQCSISCQVRTPDSTGTRDITEKGS